MDVETFGAIVAVVAMGAAAAHLAFGAVGTKSRREIWQELRRGHLDGKCCRR